MCSTKDLVIWGRAAGGFLGPMPMAPPVVPFPFVGEDGEEGFNAEDAEFTEPD